MKKLFTTILLFVLICSTLTVTAATTLYEPNGKTIRVKDSTVASWEKVGWYKYPVMKMYAPDCRSIVIPTSEYTKWKNVGWHKYPYMYVYSPDGRKKSIKVSDFATWYNVGWSYAPGATLTTKWLTDMKPIALQNITIPEYQQMTLYYQMMKHYFVPVSLPKADFNSSGVYAVYYLNKKYKFVSGTLSALFHGALKQTSTFKNRTEAIKVEFYADDVKIGESPAVKINDYDPVEISADVRNCEFLKIKLVECGGSDFTCHNYYECIGFGNVKLYK